MIQATAAKLAVKSSRSTTAATNSIDIVTRDGDACVVMKANMSTSFS
jgi:hypothetical protein